MHTGRADWDLAAARGRRTGRPIALEKEVALLQIEMTKFRSEQEGLNEDLQEYREMVVLETPEVDLECRGGRYRTAGEGSNC